MITDPIPEDNSDEGSENGKMFPIINAPTSSEETVPHKEKEIVPYVLPRVPSTRRSTTTMNRERRRVKTEEEIEQDKKIKIIQLDKMRERRRLERDHDRDLQEIKDELKRQEKDAAIKQYQNVGVSLPAPKFDKAALMIAIQSGEVKTRESLVDMPGPNKECFICKVRQGGCALCWDFPEWVMRNNGNPNSVEYVSPLQPRDYAFEPGDDPMVAVVQAGGTRIRPPMHTNMTTHTSIKNYRNLYGAYTTFNVKTVPAGATVSVTLDVNQCCVEELYDAFKSNSAPTEVVHLYLPTEAGIFSMCDQDEQETELLRANINAFEKLNTYNIGVCGGNNIKHSTVSILNYPWFSEVEASDAFKRRAKPAFDTVERYIIGCFGREEKKPLTNICYTTKGSLSMIPTTTSLPGPDLVQQRLAPVLLGEQRLYDHVEALEEAEDIKKTKAGIEEMETKRKAMILRGGRESAIMQSMQAIDDEVNRLQIDYEAQKGIVEELRENSGLITAEMANIDRIILTSQKQKVKKPSDLKALKNFGKQFNELDEERVRIGSELRVAIKEAAEMFDRKEKVRSKRKAVEEKLTQIRNSTSLKIPDTAKGGISRRIVKNTF